MLSCDLPKGYVDEDQWPPTSPRIAWLQFRGLGVPRQREGAVFGFTGHWNTGPTALDVALKSQGLGKPRTYLLGPDLLIPHASRNKHGSFPGPWHPFRAGRACMKWNVDYFHVTSSACSKEGILVYLRLLWASLLAVLKKELTFSDATQPIASSHLSSLYAVFFFLFLSVAVTVGLPAFVVCVGPECGLCRPVCVAGS